MALISDIQLEQIHSSQRMEELVAKQKIDLVALDAERQIQFQLEDDLRKAYEIEFQRDFGEESGCVRDGYVHRLRKLCGSCVGKGHSVCYIEKGEVTGDVIDPGSGHVYLLPEHFEQAKLTERERRAFEVIGLEVWIDPEAHPVCWVD